MYYSNKSKNKKNNSNNNQEKIIINSITDLLKIPIHKLNNSNLDNLSGKYFDKIYQEAINSENQKDIQKSSYAINKSRKNNKTNNNAENISQKNKRKKKSNITNNLTEKKDFYVEEIELGLPEAEHNRYKYLSDSKNNIKNKNFISHKNNNNNINNITPFKNDENEEVFIFGENQTPGNNYDENNFYIKNNFYLPSSTTPTPNPDLLDEEDKKKIVIYPLNKIIFSIIYNTIYGEEVCVLGSSAKLGMWKYEGALHLGWNEGNLWKGEINIGVEDLQDFEFKFIIVEKGKIKYWESGNNNIVNFTGLINEFQFKQKGKYNKYEYDYHPNDGSLTIKCNWNK
jgi:hypothetical protein